MVHGTLVLESQPNFNIRAAYYWWKRGAKKEPLPCLFAFICRSRGSVCGWPKPRWHVSVQPQDEGCLIYKRGCIIGTEPSERTFMENRMPLTWGTKIFFYYFNELEFFQCTREIRRYLPITLWLCPRPIGGLQHGYSSPQWSLCVKSRFSFGFEAFAQTKPQTFRQWKPSQFSSLFL